MFAQVTYTSSVGPLRLTHNPVVTPQCHRDYVVWRAEPLHLFVDMRMPIRVSATVKSPECPNTCWLAGNINMAGTPLKKPFTQTLIQGRYVWAVTSTRSGAECVTINITGYTPLDRPAREDTTPYTDYDAAIQLVSMAQTTVH